MGDISIVSSLSFDIDFLHYTNLRLKVYKKSSKRLHIYGFYENLLKISIICYLWKGLFKIMIKRSIKFSSVNEIKEFVNLTMVQTFDIDLMAGRYVADAKSILAVFGLDLDSEVTIGIHATEKEAEDFLGKISKYLA